MITVFYDGKCGLCSREIGHYMKISPPTTFIWRDIANEPQHLKKINVSQSERLGGCMFLTKKGPSMLVLTRL